MAPNKGPNRAGEFEQLVKPIDEFDPEADDVQSDDDSDSGEVAALRSDLTAEARSHYVKVEESQLRKPKTAPLGPRYRGTKIGREALSSEEEGKDPFSKNFDELGSEQEDGNADSSATDAEEDAEDTPETDMTDDEPQDALSQEVDRSELKRIMAEENRAVAASIFEANKLDAAKGRAVTQQRKAFDALLNTRIKLQKAMIGVNSVAALQKQESSDVGVSSVERAEQAAFSLWSALNDFREELEAGKTGSKRKRTRFGLETSTMELWKHSKRQDEDRVDPRVATLQKWSAKARGVSALSTRDRINNTEAQVTIMDVVREHLSSSERALKRAHTPRSCAPLQLEQRIAEDDRIYDDADFYGLLLKELLEQKSQDSGMTANVDLSFQLRREAKTKKVVDTKASKGRKLRYTVHEKLQNFMAPEDRGTWGQRQADELFGSLFGQRLGLGEERGDEHAAMNGDEDEDGEAGMIMFGQG